MDISCHEFFTDHLCVFAALRLCVDGCGALISKRFLDMGVMDGTVELGAAVFQRADQAMEFRQWQ
jgi:hypothetical protein